MELRKCPYCRSKIITEGICPELHHVCLHDVDFTNGVSVLISGNKQDVIDKWNGVYEDEESESL